MLGGLLGHGALLIFLDSGPPQGPVEGEMTGMIMADFSFPWHLIPHSPLCSILTAILNISSLLH